MKEKQQFGNTSDLRKAVLDELQKNVLPYWLEHSRDKTNGGFWGQIGYDNSINPRAEKSSIICSRILWSFSQAYHKFGDDDYRRIADWAFDFVTGPLYDKTRGVGVFEKTDYKGTPLDSDTKSTVTQCYAVYGLSEYAKATGNKSAADRALEIFKFIKQNAYDTKYAGYFDTCCDTREENGSSTKTLGTQIHILESFTNLYSATKETEVKEEVTRTVKLFINKLFSEKRGYLPCAFNRDFTPSDPGILYGHNLEAAWLLLHAVDVLGNNDLKAQLKKMYLTCIDFVIKHGIDKDGGIMMFGDPVSITDSNKFWWAQAEGMVAFSHAYRMTDDKKYLRCLLNTWKFINRYLIDSENGEWFLRVTREGSLIEGDSKIEAWKGPYHTVRSCIQILNM